MKKLLGKFARSKYLIKWCSSCGYAIDVNSFTGHWDICPLCGHELVQIWHQSKQRYSIAAQDADAPTS